MALFLVMISLALMASVVGDLSYNETIRYKVALNERDSFKAEALAEGGLNLARLFLIIQGKIQPYITTFASLGVPLPAFTLWELMPLDTEMFQSLASGDLISSFGIDIDEAVDKRLNDRKEKKAKTESSKKPEEVKAGEKIRFAGEAFEPPVGGFGAFDGTFEITIQDEESKISLRNWAASSDGAKKNATQKLLSSLIRPSRYDDLFNGSIAAARVDRPTFIANIYDYIDLDTQKVDAYTDASTWGHTFTGTPEIPLTTDQPKAIPKNAYFDSFGELRLVEGMTDGHIRAFGDALTIYGDEGKVNILSAKDQVIETLVYFCAQNQQDLLLNSAVFVDETVKGWKDYKEQGLGPVSPQGFIGFLQKRNINVDDKMCQSVLDVKSYNFKLISSATVNGVKRTLTLVTRVVNNVEEMYYFLNN
ncbi:MAG: type II secretion system protein GspK [bacterium]|nr:type II secretion system protein GspK [bacterium]